MEENKNKEAAVEEKIKEETVEASEDSKASEESKAPEDKETSKKAEEKKLFKKKDKKENKKEADKKDEQIEELKDRLMRSMAEFDNYRKRSEKEKAQMFEVGARDVVEKILPVIDNFERGLAAIPEDLKENPFTLGMEQIYKQFLTVLETAGVTPIDAVGKEFDPNFHNAVMHDEDETMGENIVAEELQKGYMYRDTVVRHSMVKVVN
ncbi:MAG: nucleotide exchange factor GrpE [Acetivibrio ethanolgignens]